MSSDFEVVVTEHYGQQPYCDEAGYEVTYRLIEERVRTERQRTATIKRAEEVIKDLTAYYSAKIDGTPNGSNPSTGIVWSNRVNTREVERGYRVWINYPIGD